MATNSYQQAYEALLQSMYAAGVQTGAQFQAISEQFTAAQFAQAAEQSQQFSYVQNLDESIRYYQMVNPDCEYALAPATGASGIINSNDSSIRNNLKNTFTTTLVSTATLNALDTVLSLGEVRKPAQTSTQKALAFGSKVCLPVQIASVATMLGKQIDNTVYKLANAIGLNPPEALNPQTWNSLVSNDDVYGQVFNWLLNVDPDTGELSAYADLDSVAYCAQWLKEQGFFDAGTDLTANYDGSTASFINPSLTSLAISEARFYTNDGTYLKEYTFEGPVYRVLIKYNNTLQQFLIAQENYRQVETVTVIRTGQTWTNYSSPLRKNNINTYVSNSDVYSNVNNNGNYQPQEPYNTTTIQMANAQGAAQVATIIIDGTISSQSIPGVEDNGGQLPDTSTWTDIPAVKQSLIQQYPDIDSNPIVVDTVQPDGSTKQYTYVPVPLPADVDPLGNPDTQNVPATQQSVDPETATNPQLQMIIQLLTELTPLLAPVPQPEPEPEQDPDEVAPPIDGSNDTNPDYTGPSGIGTGIAPIPPIPQGTASALWTVYNPSQSELNSFGGWLWSPAFIDNILKLFANPMDAIIGVHKIFAPVPTGSSKHIKCGFLDSGVSASTVNTQYIDVDCGSVNLFEYFGNVFDYDPHTKVSIYLPFIGVVPLKTAEVMRSTINVTYGVDLYTGSCLAKIHITRDAGAGGILYSYGGSCACYYPLSSGSYSGIISGVLSAAVGITGTVLSGSPMPAVRGIAHGITRASLDVQHTGGFTGPSGVMGPKTPYLIIVRPQSKMASDYESYDGVPSNTTTTLGKCHGYTKCKEVHLKVYGAYKEESDEIVRLLKEGVLFPE